jgi:hypothetical protein
MKEVNLISLVQAYKSLSQPLYESYLSIFKVSPKENEIDDLYSFINQLRKISPDINVFDNYFVGYTIPQISKEFDLLRFGEDCVVNIELKSTNTGAKIYKQIIRNQYYLSFLKKKIYVFTYVSSEEKFYSIDVNQNFISVDIYILFNILSNQIRLEISNIDEFFNPSNYLVSPFNSTDQFIGSKYFLTAHQEEIKIDCTKDISKKKTSFISICGKAGTGKTLLTFDIAKEYISVGKKVLIIHCGYLNRGHIILRDTYGWDVIPIKEWNSRNLLDYFLVVIDETQRIFPTQLKGIISEIKQSAGNCIFSYDSQQCLRNWEVSNNIPQVIEDDTSSKVFQLTEKIRTNKEIASFIIALFNKSKDIEKFQRDNIELRYFQNSKDAKKYVEMIGEQGWKIINYTPSRIHRHPYEDYSIALEDNAHGVIGQEFDKVIAVIDEFFYYNGDKLSFRNYVFTPYYHPSKMLFQIMTRTRKKLSVVIINNNEIMERCLSILT